MKKNFWVIIISLFLFQSGIIVGELQTSSFRLFSEDILSRQSNMINFSSGFDNEVIGWEDVTDEIPGGLSLVPEISFEKFLSVLTEAITILKSKNKIFQQMSYVSWMTKGVSKYLGQATFEPFKIAKTFGEFDEVHVFGAQNSSVHDVISLFNLGGYGDEGNLFKENSWQLLTNFQQKHFVITGLIGNGLYGIETLFAALKLYIANPDNIFIVQGANEIEMLFKEIHMRYADQESRFSEISNQIIRLYRYLPVAFFAGFEKENNCHWYLIAHSGVQAGDSQMQELFTQARQEGVSYKKVTNFSGQSTGYQNKDEINIDTVNPSQLFGMIDNSEDNILKGAIFGGRHIRDINNETTQMLKYGYFSRPGLISLAPTPLSLFGVVKPPSYPGIIHRTSLLLHSHYLYISQHMNIDILTAAKMTYAQMMHMNEGSYIIPLYVDINRIIGEVSLDGDDIIPTLQFNADMFRQEEDIERVNEDTQAMNIIIPTETPKIELIEEERFDELSESGDEKGMEQAVKELNPQVLEIYEQVIANDSFGWQEVVKNTKQQSLWDFLMSIKPTEATLDDWVATVNDSYFWTTGRRYDLRSWKQLARVRWRNYMTRKKRLEEGRK